MPNTLIQDVQKFLNNPGCACNHPIYKKVLKEAKEQLIEYFPEKIIKEEKEEENNLMKNDWEVINCSIDDLQSQLRKLRHGRKQLEIARFQDQVTVIINHIDY